MARTITRSNFAAALTVVVVALVGAVLAKVMIQAAIAFSLLVFLFGVRLQSRRSALVLLWVLWLLVPLLRRCLELSFVAPAADPLVVLPIAGTLLLAAMEFREDRLNQRSRTVLTLAGAAIFIGAPVGLTLDPAAAIFAGLAYTAGLSALILGWGDEVRAPARHSMIERVLTIGLVPIALYGIAQYFLPLTRWDSQWVEAVEGSELAIISPQEGHIRIFATLNSPFTFAVVLSVGIMFALGLRRRARYKAMILAPLVVALALTYVRSAWLALIVGAIVYAASGDDRSVGKTISVVVVVLAAVVVVGGSNPTTRAFTERFTSLGSPGSDYSANDRFTTSARLIPEAGAAPIGKGLGQTGLAAKLNESTESGVVNIDNGYLATLYQSGAVAFLLMLIAFFAVVRAAMQALANAPPAERSYRATILAILVMMLVAQATGDVLFGITGVVFWYLGGLSFAAAARARVPKQRVVPAAINAPVPVANV